MPRISDQVRVSITALMLGTLIGIALLLGAVALGRVHNVGVGNCQQIETLKTTIRRVVTTADQQLGRPGTAGYQYYQTHPAELAQAHAAARAELAQFKPRSC